MHINTVRENIQEMGISVGSIAQFTWRIYSCEIVFVFQRVISMQIFENGRQSTKHFDYSDESKLFLQLFPVVLQLHAGIISMMLNMLSGSRPINAVPLIQAKWMHDDETEELWCDCPNDGFNVNCNSMCVSWVIFTLETWTCNIEKLVITV